MNSAVAVYNTHTSLTKHVIVSYDAGVPTAQGSSNGTIQFGSQRNARTALHELGHTFKIGTSAAYSKYMVNGVWQGPAANALIKELDGPAAEIHGDRAHFWPYGLNFDSEMSPDNARKHVLILQAMVKDMQG